VPGPRSATSWSIAARTSRSAAARPGAFRDRVGAVPAVPPGGRRGAEHPLAARATSRPPRWPRSAGSPASRARPDDRHGLFLTRNGLAPPDVATYSSQAAAIAAAAAGEGIALTLARSVVEEVRRRALVRLRRPGDAAAELWHASTLGLGRALPAALALQRFATTSDAAQAISTAAPARSRPACAEGARDALALGRRRARARDGHAEGWWTLSAMLGGPADRAHDGRVARAAADLARDRDPDLVVGRVGLRSSRRAAVSIIPGVQNPHCSPCSS
jgi:hypothetical protein